MSIIDLIAQINNEIMRESHVKEFMERQVKILAPGSLIIRRRGNDTYYFSFVYVDGRRKAIALDPDSRYHRQVIRELTERKTITHGLPILRGNIEALRRCMSELKPYNPLNYKYGDLLNKAYYLEDDVCVRDWRKKPDSQNDYFRKGLIHKTKIGKMVRSKSEVLIADSLYDAKLEFKSEAVLRLANRTVYPDFEILHPKTHKLIWWEHLGLVGDQEYVCENIEKIIEYGRTGIVPGKNLIITYETQEKPLTHEVINQRLKEFDLI